MCRSPSCPLSRQDIDCAEGYDTPRNLQNYAIYLDTRIRTYKELKHDPVRVQAESNRDARVESEIGQSAVRGGSGPQRSKTIMGRKLRSMTVEKGLLRETKAVQRAMSSLVECQVIFFRSNGCQHAHECPVLL